MSFVLRIGVKAILDGAMDRSHPRPDRHGRQLSCLLTACRWRIRGMADRRPAVFAVAGQTVMLISSPPRGPLRPVPRRCADASPCLRVAMADAENLGRPAVLQVDVRDRPVQVDPDQAAGMRRRVLRVVAVDAVAEAGAVVRRLAGSEVMPQASNRCR